MFYGRINYKKEVLFGLKVNFTIKGLNQIGPPGVLFDDIAEKGSKSSSSHLRQQLI